MPSPRVSLITAVYNPPADAFEDTIASVLGQTHEDWEWVLSDDRSPAPWVLPRLRELAAKEPRVRIVERAENGGIVAASNSSLAEATGELIALLDHDDVLEPNALEKMVRAYDRFEDLDYAYSDQDLMSDAGELRDAYYKPDWSPERLRHHNYCTHFSVFRRSVVEEVGGFQEGFDGSQDHDLVLRVSERARRIVHVPGALYHWRMVPGSAAADNQAKPYAWDAGVRAVQAHLDRLGIRATASRGVSPGLYRVEREPDLDTPVSVIIPTIGTSAIVWGEKRAMVVETVRSVVASTQHRNVEFVIVYDTPTPAPVLEALRAIEGADIKLVEFTEKFSFSAKCNVGAAHATGDVLIFLNDDMEAYSEGVIENLIAPLREPDVGMTGPKLLFEDYRIQHAGLVYGSGTITHAYYRARPEERGNHGELHINRETSALTGACLAMRREVFFDAGGFSERLPVNYNDVDLCLKVRRSLGLRLVWLHDVTLFHFESVSRDNAVHDWEKDFINNRWGNYEYVREAYSNGVR
ncbi:glycosyltransferase [Nocardioides sp. NPDC000445]|uniref:glycosyltransferase family 2 protein n=1 Tax=Nocardioides sp. NPDC000445 TaxID=3154257 RepID=UPI00331C2E12